MTTRAATSLGPILLALLLATPLAAQRFGRDAADWYPLGGIEAWGDLAVVGERPAIEIKKVAEGGLAARAGLVPGDRIVAAGGKKLSGKSEEVVANLCEQIDKAEGRSPRGEFSNLVLEVQGTDGKSRKVDRPVRAPGSARARRRRRRRRPPRCSGGGARPSHGSRVRKGTSRSRSRTRTRPW
ncbi:MAG: PDZ domain-containing protein [Planctomycetota bacterium]